MSAIEALLLTVAVETPLYAAALVALRLTGPALAMLLGVGVNLITHPVLWRVLTDHPALHWLALAEGCVCLVETGMLWLAVRRDPALLLVLGIGANAASVALGLLIG
ncbi:MAG: hypothetical protein GXX79_06280 [Actinomycetales bacterium]|nr:hypothetical protein [Actinomycetales bacterium]